jgi:hypothetical protein
VVELASAFLELVVEDQSAQPAEVVEVGSAFLEEVVDSQPAW